MAGIDNILPNAWQLEADLEVSGSKWKNTFSIGSDTTAGDTPPAVTAAIVTGFQAFISGAHYNDVTFDQIVLRSAIQRVGGGSGVEYPPIWTKAINAACTGNAVYGAAQNSNYLPKDASLYVKKTTSGGRSGKNFMRNILTEVDVSSALSGEWSFSPGAGHFDPAVFNALVTSQIGSFLTDPPGTEHYFFVVLHLMNLKAGDVRSAGRTLCTAMTAHAPTWNKSSR